MSDQLDKPGHRPPAQPNQTNGESTATHRRQPSPARIAPSSLRRPLWAVALLGTLAACGTRASTASEPTTTLIDTPTTSPAPTTTASSTTTSPASTTTVTPPTSAAPTTATVEPTVTVPATVARQSEPVDVFAIVSGAHMHVRCVGAGPATVLLIAGFTEGGESWGSIEAPIAEHARVCTPARFGTGTSDPPPATQTFRSQAADLHTALGSIAEPGPYVVVGHSYGGAEAVAFASMFPGEVGGLMLVDATPITWPAESCAVPDDGSDMAQVFRDICAAYPHPESNPERLDVPAAFADIATITTLGALPTTVLTAATRSYPGLDPAEAARLSGAWDQGQQRWASLSTNGHVVPVADTGHHIQLDQPAVVIEQTQHLLDTSTTPAAQTTAAAPSTIKTD